MSQQNLWLLKHFKIGKVASAPANLCECTSLCMQVSRQVTSGTAIASTAATCLLGGKNCVKGHEFLTVSCTISSLPLATIVEAEGKTMSDSIDRP